MDALRAFVATADLGSVTAAADHLGRSQPAISLQLKKLEEHLGIEVFLRFNKQLSLSDAGSAIYDDTKTILALNDQLLNQFAKPELAGQIRPVSYTHLTLPTKA